MTYKRLFVTQLIIFRNDTINYVTIDDKFSIQLIAEIEIQFQ